MVWLNDGFAYGIGIGFGFICFTWMCSETTVTNLEIPLQITSTLGNECIRLFPILVIR